MFSHSSNYYNVDTISAGILATPAKLLRADLQSEWDSKWQIPSPVHDSPCIDTIEDKIRLLKVTKLLPIQYL